MMRSRRKGTVRRAFTLIELVVAIGVIVLLVGLTLTAGSAVIERSERSRTETVLQLLDLATREWEREARRQLTWGTNNEPGGAAYDVQQLTGEIFIISEVLRTISRVDSVKAILTKIEPKFMYRYQAGTYPSWVQGAQEEFELDLRFLGSATVLDAWGTPIYATHFGAVYDASLLAIDPEIYPLPLYTDPDGTTRTPNEHKYGITKGRRICFVSAGPDGEFGNLFEDPDSQEFAFTRDNIYSYPVQDPRAVESPDGPPPPEWPGY